MDRIKNTQDFIVNSMLLYGDNRYDYSLVNYKTNETYVDLICPKHGVFQQTPHQHLRKTEGCRKCSVKRVSSKITMTRDEFINLGNLANDNKYDYSKVEYINARTPVIITCPIHGDFPKRPYEHIRKSEGCQKCSKIEQGIKHRTHGCTVKEKAAFFSVWRGVMDRCFDTSHHHYKSYGGRGITVSDEFKDPAVFVEYISSLPNADKRKELKLSLDRIEVDKGYERGNLRWADSRTQSLNRRNGAFNNKKAGVNFHKKNNKYVVRVSIGSYDTLEDALSAKEKAIELLKETFFKNNLQI